MTTQGDVNLPSDLGRDVDWSLTVSAARDGSMVELTRFAASGAGLEFSGSGHSRLGGNELNGRVQLAIADLRPFTSVFGRPIDGALTLGVTAGQLGPDRMTAEIEGAVTGLRSGIPAIDALAGSSIAITGSAQRNSRGFAIDRLTVAGTGFSAEGTGDFDPETRQLAATLNLELPRLQPLGAAVRAVLGGRVSTQIKAGGTLDHPSLRAHVEGVDLAVNGAKFSRLRLDADVADISEPKVTVDGEFQGAGIDGSLALEADATDRAELLIPHLRLKAAGGAIEAQLRIARESLVTRGSVSATMPDLSRWSRLLGVPLSGSVNLKAGLDARSGQSLDMTVSADHLTSGTGPSQAALRHLAISARLSDLFGMPTGKAQATLTAASFPAGGLANTNLTIDSTRPGRFVFAAETKGKLAEQVAISLGGECDLASHDAGIEIHLARLTGSIGSDTFQLRQPLILAKRGSNLTLSDLALSLGGGQVHGNAALRGNSLSAQFTARDLSVAAIARPAGYKDASGTVTLEASLSGTIAAPQGRFTLSGQALRIALQKQPRLPTLALNADGTWNGRTADVKGRVAGAKGDALDFTASAPLVLSAAPLAISMPPQGSLSAHIQGAGDFANLADLLPLGEDRLTGHFAIDVSASGTLAAPAAAGHLTVSNGRYESFATGAVLAHLRVDLAGDRDRFTLHEFAADDAAGGNVAARGSLVLGGGAGPTADFSANLTNLRVAARDEAVVNATGTIIVSGPIASPKVSGELAITSGDFTIPTSLPPTVARLDVVETRGKTGTPPTAKATSPALVAALDITITVPERVFVRGHGLDSEWRGKLKINGTSAAPQIVGALDAVRGTFAILGKNFRVTRGKIAFAGGSKLDPTLDIVSELSAADITAQILVGGMASSPKITLTSTPAVPQDEILARVLFNNSVGQITPAEGIEVAQAAATLAGGGPDVIDRLRGRLGLDRLGFGSAPTGIATSNLNPAAGGSAASRTTGTAVSGGRYVAEGVYVGATQGTTPQSSAVTVEIEVHRHVTVETDLSQTNGNGIGLNYKLDY
jgi:translocation and assembly module TamB